MADEEVFSFTQHSHRRYNPLRDSWVLVSPHRTQRPWQGAQESVSKETLPGYDPKCYLCPGNTRAQGDANEKYTSTFVFVNDYSAVRADQPALELTQIDDKAVQAGDKSSLLLRCQGVRGRCFVICFNPNHNVTVAEMDVKSIAPIIDAWVGLYTKIRDGPDPFSYAQIFENKGSAMGCSNPHPHGQAWCTEIIPEEPAQEIASMTAYQNKVGSCLLCDYVGLELSESQKGQRIVVQNASFVAVCPYWAVWPFETMILSKRHAHDVTEFSGEERGHLADIFRQLTCRYDNLFTTSFPYSMGLHQAPTKAESAVRNVCHFHMHFYPPLLRGATVRKFLVGFEMLGEPQRDLTVEQAAARLRDLPDVHYKQASS